MSHCCRCGFICSRFDHSELGKPSNETLLCVAFASFMGFAAVQTVVALIAQSAAMMGDTAAMAVDALTYGFNLYAERKKNEDNEENHRVEELEIELSAGSLEDGATYAKAHDDERIKLERNLRMRRRHLKLELVPPIMSVSILLVVIGIVFHESIRTLILDAHRSKQEQSIPNLKLMMTFSVLNLGLDLMNVTCFARAKHLMGYNTEDNKEVEGVQKYNEVGTNSSLVGESRFQYDNDDPVPEMGNGSTTKQQEDPSNNIIILKDTSESGEIEEDDRVNLNMCSAYTHVFADTLRSLAVIIATTIAQMVESVTPEVADATAAVIVSLIILFSLLPLFRGLLNTWRDLQSVTREELALLANGPNDFEVEMKVQNCEGPC
eukprot:CAMPEP_0172528634 /NCGR_PEP_ID=MMETSP1067-20121228/2968_1 /TAXON_ID=265564 ORGANISM="Thalassiosira punctigera, Strain Tpunct2005C2" /NCGR_SAMPLE_ID=MMETSP1067 /ASSEMBLY_ACC=CAM_ASM_000444 /LENGTH=377 /DNA_ID=CAMNT_0013312583 /DNA_START=149 /DNA_END=1282 /DNA_ORIENTATION=-